MTEYHKILFENLIYRVELNDDMDGYVVVNKDTEIFEKHEDYLPDAILAAIEGQARLKWYEDVAAAQAAEDEGESDEDETFVAFELDDRTIN